MRRIQELNCSRFERIHRICEFEADFDAKLPPSKPSPKPPVCNEWMPKRLKSAASEQQKSFGPYHSRRQNVLKWFHAGEQCDAPDGILASS